MRTFLLTLCCMVVAISVHAAQNCKPDSVPASTPDSQLTDNGNGTVTDSKTGLIWKKCLEGVSGNSCDKDSPGLFTWQQAQQQPGTVNQGGGFAGYADWRLPDIKELRSLVEEKCYNPAINLKRFPKTPSSIVWSGSPYADDSAYAWLVGFNIGFFGISPCSSSFAVRLVRGGK